MWYYGHPHRREAAGLFWSQVFLLDWSSDNSFWSSIFSAGDGSVRVAFPKPPFSYCQPPWVDGRVVSREKSWHGRSLQYYLPTTPGWAGEAPNKICTYNMENRICILTYWRGVSFIVLPYKYAAHSSPAFGEHRWDRGRTGWWKTWAKVPLNFYRMFDAL